METPKNLFKALAAFQNEVPVIHKGTKGYGYSYAGLPEIFEKINPLLKKHGLGFTQLIQGTKIETIVFHVESGESIISLTDIPQNVELKGMNAYQVLGSAITYLRRYALSSALGLVTDKDTDAGEEKTNGKTVDEKKEWLNPNTDTWKKSVDYMKAGGNIETIAKKYSISKENREKLMRETA